LANPAPQGNHCHAWWLAEAANALWRHVRLGETSAAEALARIDELPKAPVALMSIEPYVRRALQLATRLSRLTLASIWPWRNT
jgi:predicted nucleic acid-binding protein